MTDIAVTPPIGSIDAYLRAVQKYPILTLEEEQFHGRKVRDDGDQASAAVLILSHLRFVASTARRFDGYNLPADEIIQEGNIGLMKAVKNFDPDRGVRLVSYAIHWVKAEIQEYVLRSWKLGKIATTQDQKKLFFKLRKMKRDMRNGDRPGSLSTEEVKYIASELKVKESEVVEMEERLYGVMVPVTPFDDTSESGEFHLPDIADYTYEPTCVMENLETEAIFERIEGELEGLSERERDIVNQRWLLPMIGEKKVPFRVLAEKYGISIERVRQIEEEALARVQQAVTQ